MPSILFIIFRLVRHQPIGGMMTSVINSLFVKMPQSKLSNIYERITSYRRQQNSTILFFYYPSFFIPSVLSINFSIVCCTSNKSFDFI